jgi:hypothetical protein
MSTQGSICLAKSMMAAKEAYFKGSQNMTPTWKILLLLYYYIQ